MSRDLGQYFTPPALARLLVEEVLRGWDWARCDPLRVLDPACGPGALLLALEASLPGVRIQSVGVDIDPGVAAVARVNLPDARIVTGDALALAARGELEDGSVDLMLLNPPYLGEKGRKSLFARTAALGPRWAERSAARMDYLYYFLHLALDLLRPGGRMMALTTAYWPSATSAHKLRRDLASRGCLLRWVSLEGHAAFQGAHGQHNLALILERAEGEPSTSAKTWLRVCVDRRREVQVVEEVLLEHALSVDGSPWNPFVRGDDARWAEETEAAWGGLRLGDLVQDRQGVVSGCDRVTARHVRLLGEGGLATEGDSVFVLTGREVIDRGWDRDLVLRRWLRPLLRGSQIEPWAVYGELRDFSAPGTRVILYLRRGDRPPEVFLEHLAPVRALLERRREVREGKLPWWALHWPRSLEDFLAPKLVTARRGGRFAFGLDLAGHVVSSDCTLLRLKEGSAEDLVTLWRALHEPDLERLMRVRGKLKGGLMEFYSDPLRRLCVPLRRSGEEGLCLRAVGEAREGLWGDLRGVLDPETLRRLSVWVEESV